MESLKESIGISQESFGILIEKMLKLNWERAITIWRIYRQSLVNNDEYITLKMVTFLAKKKTFIREEKNGGKTRD